MFDRHASDRLAAYLDGETAGIERARVEAHLGACARCREELEEVLIGRAALELLPVANAPDGLWNAIEVAADSRRKRRFTASVMWRFAAAALVTAMAAGGYWSWSRHSVGSWEVVALDGSPVADARQLSGSAAVRNGQWVETDAASRARILIGKIGSVDMEPNTRVRLVSTGTSGHRLALRNGGIAASISAPPRLFFVDTPAGTAVDLGCEYRLQCDRGGNGLLHVSSGWVSLEWKGRESLVPAGASCRMYAARGPGTPWFDDAPRGLVGAVERFDLTRDREQALVVILAEARARDTLTLWHLLSHVDAGDRVRVYDRMAALAPPPVGVSRESVVALDTESLKRWREELAWIW